MQQVEGRDAGCGTVAFLYIIGMEKVGLLQSEAYDVEQVVVEDAAFFLSNDGGFVAAGGYAGQFVGILQRALGIFVANLGLCQSFFFHIVGVQGEDTIDDGV